MIVVFLNEYFFCSVPIGRNQFSNESVLEPLKRRLLMALRELVDGAKLFAMQARRERIDHNDIDAFIRHAHLPVGLLYLTYVFAVQFTVLMNFVLE